MDLRDIFGDNPNRPDNPDFWKLSEVLLKLDSGLDPSDPDDEAKQRQWEARMKEVGIDTEAVSYAAVQRAQRVLGVRTRQDLAAKAPQVMMLASVWLDAFAAGVFFERKDS